MNITSIQTKLAGLGAILAAIEGVIITLTDNDPLTNPEWTAVSAAIAAGWGLMLARQNNVKSETVAQVKEMVEPKPEYLPLTPK